MSLKSLAKYFHFTYWPFLKEIMREGRYDQMTYKDPITKKTPVISTIFYLDGDVQHRLNEVEGEILAEQHKQLVETHMDQVELNVCSMDLIFIQIQAVITLFVALITFFNAMDFYSLKDSLFITAGTTSFTLIFKKYIAKGILFLLRVLLKSYLKAFTKQWTG